MKQHLPASGRRDDAESLLALDSHQEQPRYAEDPAPYRSRRCHTVGTTTSPVDYEASPYLSLSNRHLVRSTLHLSNLLIQAPNFPQSLVPGSLLRDLHVSTLQPLRKHIHDLARHIANVLIVEVDVFQDNCQPIETLIDVGGEGCRNGGGHRQGNERRHLFKIAGIDADEDLVKEEGLIARLKPL